jgi:hypothetical protein
VISPFLVPIVFFISLPVTIIGVILARAHVRQVERRGAGGELGPELTARLDRMEQAVDAIAVEVERISDAQRFTTRLLAGRSESPGQRIEGQSSGGSR